MLALVPAWMAAAADGMLSAQPFFIRVGATVAVAAVMAHLVARYLADPMDAREMLCVTLTGAIPAALCSRLSDQRWSARHQPLARQ